MILNLNSFKTRLPLVFGVALAVGLALACSGPSEPAGPAQPTRTAVPVEPTAKVEVEDGVEAGGEPITVVTTTNIVADWVSHVGGEHVEVTSLLPVGADPHSFQPGARDVARVADADLVLSVGLGLEEGWLVDLIRNAARDPSSIIELAEAVDPLEFAESHIEEVDLIEEVSHVVHEVEEGEIDALEGLAEIRSLIESAEAAEEDHADEEAEGDHHADEEAEGEDHADEEAEGEDHADEEADGGEDHGDEEEHHGEVEELAEQMLAIVSDAEAGLISAEDAIEALEELAAEGEEEHADHGHGLLDPHFWFDPLRVKLAVGEIANILSGLDPERTESYEANAYAYGVKLDEVHAWTEEQLASLPAERRLLLTSHESLGYFAVLYDFEVVGVILSITTEVEPSAEDIAKLIEQAKLYQVPAVFGETTVGDRMARSLAAEAGASYVSLYSGSLGGPDSDASTYLDMVRANVVRIAEALK